MPPAFKFKKEEIIEATLNLVREKGINSLTARGLAEILGTSPKPIFGLFSGMEELKNEVLSYSHELYLSYINESLNSQEYPPYKASGMAYIRFAKEEKELFKLLFMRDRTNENKIDSSEDISPLIDILTKKLNITKEQATLFHLEMWVYVHGIATMTATSYLEWDLKLISDTLTDVYLGLVHRFTEVNNDSN